ncbi:MAG TPA: PBP1A family penicillin-binding protein [Firmicutes bacterium]|nr:PBP1A family penicillin-binding protein [Bacillota bacterium]
MNDGRKQREHSMRGPLWTPSRLLYAIALASAIILMLVPIMARLTPLPGQTLVSTFYDIHGRVITTTATANRIEIPLSQIPQDLQNAVIAIEDSRFYKHFGIDPFGIMRAIVENIRARRIVAGGSTITQQLAKNMFLPPERTLWRKVRELLLTFYLEMKFSKPEILRRYLNLVYLGHGAYGVEAGARVYFSKSARDLTLAESALLAGLIRGPYYYSPYINMQAALERRAVVLNRMHELGYITKDQAREADSKPLRLAGLQRREYRAAPYFIDYITDQILRRHSNDGNLLHAGGLKIYTTLDLELQRAAEEAFAAGLDAVTPPQLRGPGGEKTKPPALLQPQGALVAIDPATGYVNALIGGRSFSATEFNRAIHARRQPGSAFKPFVYAAAIDNGYTAAWPFMCEPIYIPTGRTLYSPTDYGPAKYHYRVLSLRDALVVSCNVVSVKLISEIGPEFAARYARAMGIESYIGPNLSLVLGTSEVSPLEMAIGFAPLANGGFRVRPVFVTRIEDKKGRIIELNRVRKRRVLDPRTAYIVTDILKGVLRPGGTAETVSDIVTWPAAGKTGSTDLFTDAWFVGYTPHLVTCVYVANDDPSKPLGKPGGTVCAPIWAHFMKKILDSRPQEDFPRPPGIRSIVVCGESGMLPTEYCPWTKTEIFRADMRPARRCTWHFP